MSKFSSYIVACTLPVFLPILFPTLDFYLLFFFFFPFSSSLFFFSSFFIFFFFSLTAVDFSTSNFARISVHIFVQLLKEGQQRLISLLHTKQSCIYLFTAISSA